MSKAASELSLSTSLYQKLNLSALGLAKEALDYAVQSYQKLVQKGQALNNQYLTVVDFSQPSTSKRLYLIDMLNGTLVWNTYVAHGKNSGSTMAENFSNRMNSNESSLGFYVTKSTYSGKHGLTLHIAGLDEGFNDNAEARAVVVHGSSYVNEQRASGGIVGRSLGCPAVPQAEVGKIINYIKGGTVMFLYAPDQNYLQNSTVLNN
ncbi:MAG: hypothetical protein C4329_08865 [Chitinophagaceae bacterium]